MVNEREAIRKRVAEIAGGRPVRWTDSRTTMGDFSGRDWALEVFDLSFEDYNALFPRFSELRREVRARLGEALTILFHSPEDTQKYYAWIHSEQQSAEDSTS
jgi:hypothetical protein